MNSTLLVQQYFAMYFSVMVYVGGFLALWNASRPEYAFVASIWSEPGHKRQSDADLIYLVAVGLLPALLLISIHDIMPRSWITLISLVLAFAFAVMSYPDLVKRKVAGSVLKCICGTACILLTFI